MVEALQKLLPGGRLHSLPLEEVPRYEHVQTPHGRRVRPLYRITHEEEDPGMGHQAVDMGDTFVVEYRVLWRDLALGFALCSPEEGGIPAVRRGTREEPEIPQQSP